MATSTLQAQKKEVGTTFYLKLGDKVQQVQSTIPTNDQGLPVAYIDAATLVGLSNTDDPLEAAVPLSYLEGYPALNGLPFWERLESEPLDEYELFKVYRDLPFDPTNPDGIRSITRVASRAAASKVSFSSPSFLYALAKIYHWYSRARAFDIYHRLVLETRRQREIEIMENTHAKAAQKLFDIALDYFQRHTEELSGKTAVEVLKFASQLHRLSLGLFPDKPGTGTGTGNQDLPSQTIQTVINMSSDQLDSVAVTQRSTESRLLQIVQILKQSGALPSEWEQPLTTSISASSIASTPSVGGGDNVNSNGNDND